MATLSQDHAVEVSGLRTEYRENPLGIDIRIPRLSWEIRSARRGVKQSAYQIRVDDETGNLWDTGKVASDQSIHVPYAGPALRSGQRCMWRVRVWDDEARVSEWGGPAWWEMGLLATTDWQARWIDPEGEIDPMSFKPCPFLRKRFVLEDKPVRRARAYVTCHGMYQASLNGAVLGDQMLTPGFTSYHERLQYQVYDATGRLMSGENVIGVILGDGWWRGKTNALSNRNVYGERLALLMQLRIEFEDGTEQMILTDGTWRVTTGPIIKSDMKDGFIYDGRLVMTGWDRPEFDDSSWRSARVVDFGYQNLLASNGPPVRTKETFHPEILRTADGRTVLDFGQNLAGWVRFRVQGPRGTTVKLTHGEVLDENGNFTMSNLNPSNPLITKLFNVDALLQEASYTLRGEGTEEFAPLFTFQGFRYVLLEGHPGEPRADEFEALAIYSEMRVTGDFECSHPLINRLHANILWSMKGNFVDIPTDCPQREKSGWTGDAQVFARTASVLMETAPFFAKWMADLAADQRKDGLVPNVVPDPTRYVNSGVISMTNGSSGFGDAAVIIPWTMYQAFGDIEVLRRQYPSMKAYVDYATTQAKRVRWTTRIRPTYWRGAPDYYQYVWDAGYHWGEWQEADLNPFVQIARNFIEGQPSVATAFFAHSAHRLSEIAKLLGENEDARHYLELSDKVKAAWQKAFIRADGRLVPDRQATYVRALAFDLLPDSMRSAAAARLVELIQVSGYHVLTGFMASPFLCQVLCELGHVEVAYRLLEQETPPSWLYPVTKGATTTWEFWEVIRHDGKVTLGSMNHYSHGSLGAWLYEMVAGIAAGSPGYKHVLIRPRPGGSLTHARATLKSPYGQIASDWQIEGRSFTLRVVVPPNTTASVRLPRAAGIEVTESGQPIACSREDDDAVTQIGAGAYAFTYEWRD